jgi:hypothetical protein
MVYIIKPLLFVSYAEEKNCFEFIHLKLCDVRTHAARLQNAWRTEPKQFQFSFNHVHKQPWGKVYVILLRTAGQVCFKLFLSVHHDEVT